jgi:hypothetical protein
LGVKHRFEDWEESKREDRVGLGMNEIIDDVKRYMQHERWDKRNARA